MILHLDTDKLAHLEAMSYYDHNYYELPYSINGCDIAYNEFVESTNENLWYFGRMEDGKFEPKMLFYSSSDIEEIIDLIDNRIE